MKLDNITGRRPILKINKSIKYYHVSVNKSVTGQLIHLVLTNRQGIHKNKLFERWNDKKIDCISYSTKLLNNNIMYK